MMKCTDMNGDKSISADSCVCPNGKCHHGRKLPNAKDPLCVDCIDLWFNMHLRHRIKKMLQHEGAESKCIVMRSLLQFLGLSSSPNASAQTFELSLTDNYKVDRKLVDMLNQHKGSGCSNITYEIRADNLGGESFDGDSLGQYKKKYPEEANILARFLYGVHVHTAHLTWGANHSDKGPIWDINNNLENQQVVQEICRLLQKRVYKEGREVPWDNEYRYLDNYNPQTTKSKT